MCCSLPPACPPPSRRLPTGYPAPAGDGPVLDGDQREPRRHARLAAARGARRQPPAAAHHLVQVRGPVGRGGQGLLLGQREGAGSGAGRCAAPTAALAPPAALVLPPTLQQVRGGPLLDGALLLSQPGAPCVLCPGVPAALCSRALAVGRCLAARLRPGCLPPPPAAVPLCTLPAATPQCCQVSWTMAGMVDYHVSFGRHFAYPHMLVDGAPCRRACRACALRALLRSFPTRQALPPACCCARRGRLPAGWALGRRSLPLLARLLTRPARRLTALALSPAPSHRPRPAGRFARRVCAVGALGRRAAEQGAPAAAAAAAAPTVAGTWLRRLH